ncbi:plasmid mobilization relaxosome protein MobC [Salinicoccus jeotgali]|uniref:Plasmid mobilization relaxosome protein MobC n=1 Tax=Salinicoccus jeotgali TaxID=381634 RepID=A0ABP7EK38_9STAP
MGFVNEENNLMASDQLRKPSRKEPKQISFRVSEDEYEKLRQSAETLNMSVPAFVKKKAEGSRLVTPKFDKATREIIVRELSGIANNTNQIARVVNTKYVDEAHLNRNFEALRNEVNQLWQRLN